MIINRKEMPQTADRIRPPTWSGSGVRIRTPDGINPDSESGLLPKLNRTFLSKDTYVITFS